MIKKLLFLLLAVLANYNLYSQCAAYTANTACTTPAPINATPITCTPPNANGGRRNFVVTNMIAGATYRVSNCGSGLDTQMTIRDTGGTVFGYNDDDGPACAGTAASIDFVPPATGDYRIQLNKYGAFGCATFPNTSNGDIVVTLLIVAPPVYDPCATITNIASCGTNITSNFSAGIGAVAGACTFLADGQENVYTFTAPTTGNYSIQQLSSTNWIDYYYKAVSAGCGSTGWICTGAEINGAGTDGTFPLTAGTPYYIMVDPEFTTGGSAVFNIVCPPSPPPNDDCASAIVLTSDTTCNYTLGTTVNASQSQVGCAGTADDDVWYSFMATSTEHTIEVSANTIYDLVLQVFSGTCGSLTSLDCEDNNYPGGWLPDPDVEAINLTGLTVGNIYFIRVYSWDNFTFDTGSFNICITEPCVTSPIDTTPNSCEMVIDEVGTDPFAITPYNPNPSFTLDCSTTSIDLATNAQMYETTSYDVIKIPYTYIGSLGATVSNSTISDDDLWADSPTALGFPFCYYDTSYSNCLIGANSLMTFQYDANVGSFTPTPGEFSGWSFNNNLPYVGTNINTDDALFEQTIYGVYNDIDPRGLPANAITTRTQGLVGCRTFIAEWNDVPMFGDASRLYSGMIVLYETTNIIEVYIENKQIENGNNSPWNGGNSIVGVQGDVSSNEYAVAPCRNGLDYNWEVTNEAWRFVPSGNSRLTGVEWYIGTDTSGAPDATTNTYSVTVPGTYTAISTYATCGGGSVTLTDEVVVTNGSKIWNGSVDTNWYEDANWTPVGIPTSLDCVTIPDPITTFNRSPIADIINTPPLPPLPAYALNLTVANNGYLEVESDTKLVVTDWIHLDGSIDIRDTGSLIQISDGAVNINNNTGNGSLNMQRTVSLNNTSDYIYWSSPVENFGVSNVSPGSTQIYHWTPTIGGNGAGNYGNWLGTTEAMQNGKGYIIRNVVGTPTPLTPEFVGRPNNGIITKAITRGTYNGADYPGPGNTMATALDDNWNLIGNPYPSALSADTFLTANASLLTGNVAPIQGTVYLWRHLSAPSNVVNDPFYEDYVYNYNPNDYIAYNSSGSNPAGFSGNIAAGQSFFVLMDHTAPVTSSVTFNNTMRNETLDNNLFYRTNESVNNSTNIIEKHRIWLDLIAIDNSASSMLLGYIENATNEQDRLFDAYDLSDNSSRLYSLIGNNEMSIQGRALPFIDNDTVPMGITVNQSGNYSIAINTLDGLFITESQNIYIEDTALNIIHDIRLSPYSFTIDAGIHNDRFILRYTNETLEVNLLDDNDGISIIAPKSEYIKVTSEIGIINSVAVYDIVGRVIFTAKDVNQSEFILYETRLSDGAYIVKVQLFNGKQKIQKVVIRQ